jgi:thiamine biosynthesis protein ThiS
MSSMIYANGRETPANLPCSVEEFLTTQGFHPRNVVVELNLEAIPPSEFSTRPLKASDRLEIVTIVAGG